MHRKIIVLLIAAALLLPLAIPASADNSKTIVHITKTGDKYHRAGCSYLKSDNEVTLEYAVNHGYTACSRCSPPKLDRSTTKTGTASSTVTAPSATPSPRPIQREFVAVVTPSPKPKATPVPTISNQSETTFPARNFYFVFIFAGIIVVLLIINHRLGREKEQLEDNFLNAMQEANYAREEKEIAENNLQIVQSQADFMAHSIQLWEKYSGMSVNELAFRCGMPEDTYIGNDLLPHSCSDQHDKWTVYIAAKGNCFHLDSNCCPNLYPRNIGKLLFTQTSQNQKTRYRPCQRCARTFITPDNGWYDEYQKIISDLKQHNVRLLGD